MARAGTTELMMLVDSTTVEDSWGTPETVTVTTVGTWTTVLLRTVVWGVSTAKEPEPERASAVDVADSAGTLVAPGI